jgi:hypothetical protein
MLNQQCCLCHVCTSLSRRPHYLEDKYLDLKITSPIEMSRERFGIHCTMVFAAPVRRYGRQYVEACREHAPKVTSGPAEGF